MSYLLRPENAHHWENIQSLVTSPNREAADKTLQQYVLEAQRLNSNLRGARACVGATQIDGQKFSPGDFVICLFVSARRSQPPGGHRWNAHEPDRERVARTPRPCPSPTSSSWTARSVRTSTGVRASTSVWGSRSA